MNLSVANWERWQSYRRDRGQPPWIKLHRRLLRNRQWVSLSDEAKGQLVSIWILAADRDGEIPEDPAVVQKLCYLDSKPDLLNFVELGFLDKPKGYRKMASTRRHADANVTHQKQRQRQNTETDKRESARGTRMTDDWTIPQPWGQWAVDQGHSVAYVKAEAAKFKDHWLAAAGANASKRDWLATWRNWIRRAKTMNGGQPERPEHKRTDEGQGMKPIADIIKGART